MEFLFAKNAATNLNTVKLLEVTCRENIRASPKHLTKKFNAEKNENLNVNSFTMLSLSIPSYSEKINRLIE